MTIEINLLYAPIPHSRCKGMIYTHLVVVGGDVKTAENLLQYKYTWFEYTDELIEMNVIQDGCTVI